MIAVKDLHFSASSLIKVLHIQQITHYNATHVEVHMQLSGNFANSARNNRGVEVSPYLSILDTSGPDNWYHTHNLVNEPNLFNLLIPMTADFFFMITLSGIGQVNFSLKQLEIRVSTHIKA